VYVFVCHLHVCSKYGNTPYMEVYMCLCVYESHLCSTYIYGNTPLMER